jgi:hypothetical protein
MKRTIMFATMATGIAITSTMITSAAYAQTPAPAAEPESPTGNFTDSPSTATRTSPAADEQRSAQAQTQSLPPRTQAMSPSRLELAAPAPAPATTAVRTDKLHDGFYVRVNLGFGTQWTTIDDATVRPNLSAKGSTLIADLLIGAAPSPGIILGGALLFDSLPSTRFGADGYAIKTGLSLATVGPFIDGYPNPRGGFHSGAMLGASAAHLSSNPYYATENAYGFGLATWLGYDCWVADQWSVGGLLRFAGSHVVGHANSPDVGVYTRSIALLLTAVYQ